MSREHNQRKLNRDDQKTLDALNIYSDIYNQIDFDIWSLEHYNEHESNKD